MTLEDVSPRQGVPTVGWAGLVLMYHRVAAHDGNDPWSLCVQPKHFEAHLQQVASLAVGLDKVLQDRPPRRFVLLTFDDGYRDTLECALPLLERYAIPCLVFVVAGPGPNFWWEHLAAQGKTPDFSQRYRELKRSGRPQVKFMEGLPRTRLAADEWRRLQASSLVELGAHTVNHPFLPALGLEAQQAEIMASRERLVQAVGAPVRSFAYPFGAYDARTVRLVEQEGFSVAFTASRGLWRSDSCLMCVPRVMVRDLSGEDFSAALKAWL